MPPCMVPNMCRCPTKPGFLGAVRKKSGMGLYRHQRVALYQFVPNYPHYLGSTILLLGYIMVLSYKIA